MQKQKKQTQPKNEQNQNQKMLEQAAQILHNALNLASKHGAFDLKESAEIFQAMSVVYEEVVRDE